MSIVLSCAVCVFVSFAADTLLSSNLQAGELQVGAAVIDISPTQMPVIVNGGFTSRTADEIKTTVNARAIVLTDGTDTIAIVVLDSCMVPKETLDEAKQRAAKQTGIRADHMLISATHTHTAPSAFGALGTPADENYVPLLRRKIVDAIVAAKANLQIARVGWGSADAPQFTALRRWVRRPDRVDLDPFGNRTVRANMHAGANPENVTGESGPEDPQLSVIAFQSTSGKPIAVLCNFSMHYFGDQPISADYFGLFSDGIAQYAQQQHAQKNAGASESTAQDNAAQDNIAQDNTAQDDVAQDITAQDVTAQDVTAQCVGIMSHGCSGDIWKRDYMTWSGKDEMDINRFTQGLLSVAKTAYDAIEYSDRAELKMAEVRLPMKYRQADVQRLKWAEEIAATIEDDLPKTREQVYAREQILLHQMQATEVVVQALKIGDIAIATTPNETYALTGLKLKLQSPLKHTMVIELANGADGYIPPPEQHPLGGYNTWAARSAGLEEQAEPKIVAAGLSLLEKVSGKLRQPFHQSVGPAAKSILDQKPHAYFRLDEMEASAAVDSSGNHRDGVYESGVLFFLPGPELSPEMDGADNAFCDDEVNRCVHTAGGRIRTRLDSLGDQYTVMMSFWNGMPSDARKTTGWLFSRDHDHGITPVGEHLGLGGTATQSGTLVFQQGENFEVGKTPIERWTWNQVKLVRSRDRLKIYLNAATEPEIDVAISNAAIQKIETCFIGGRSDGDSNWEGRIDEVAVFKN
ncbi:MAG: LamG-like jellyroll fold domain-containing protein [Pirellulaceae bacterium]